MAGMVGGGWAGMGWDGLGWDGIGLSLSLPPPPLTGSLAVQPPRSGVPFSAAQLRAWLIPNRLSLDGSPSQVQWSAWQGRRGWIGLTIKDILFEWDKGLLCCRTANGANITPFRIAPLRALQHPSIRTLWRYGGASGTGKEVSYFTKVVYAVHRRVMGLSRRRGDSEIHPPMTLEAAIQDLEQLYNSYVNSLRSSEGTTIKKLPEKLLCKGHQDEWSPTEYEREVLKGEEIFLMESSNWGKGGEGGEEGL